jgi:hypothetical protein
MRRDIGEYGRAKLIYVSGRYESLDSEFTRDIDTDADGLILTYPGLFRRIL